MGRLQRDKEKAEERVRFFAPSRHPAQRDKLTFLSHMYSSIMSLEMLAPLEPSLTILRRTRMDFLYFPIRTEQFPFEFLRCMCASSPNDAILLKWDRRVLNERGIGDRMGERSAHGSPGSFFRFIVLQFTLLSQG
jgi:hypothetical protein